MIRQMHFEPEEQVFTAFYHSAGWQTIQEYTRKLVGGQEQTDKTRRTDNVWSLAYVDAMAFCEQRDGAGVKTARYAPTQDAQWNVTALVELAAAAAQPASGPAEVLRRYLYTPYGLVTARFADWSTKQNGVRAEMDDFGWSHFHQGGYRCVDLLGAAGDGLYHFRRRSYDPIRGQWLQRDPAGYLDSLNLHEYLGSSPINHLDPSGELINWLAGAIGAVVGAVVGAGAYAVEYLVTPGAEWSWKDFGVHAGVGAAAGGLVGLTMGTATPAIIKAVGSGSMSAAGGATAIMGTGAVSGGVAAGASNATLQYYHMGGVDWEQTRRAVIFGGATGALAAPLSVLAAGASGGGGSFGAAFASGGTRAFARALPVVAAGYASAALAGSSAALAGFHMPDSLLAAIGGSGRRLPQRGTAERRAIDAARRRGIARRQQQELANIRAGGRGSGVWSDAELRQIRRTGKFPADARWHHDPTVANRPDLADQPSSVHVIRGGTPSHLDEGHQGNWQNPR